MLPSTAKDPNVKVPDINSLEDNIHAGPTLTVPNN